MIRYRCCGRVSRWNPSARGVRDDRHEGRGERPARQPRRYEHRGEEQAPRDFNDSLDHNNDVE